MENSDRKLLITDNRKAVPTSRQVYIENQMHSLMRGTLMIEVRIIVFSTLLDSPCFFMDKISASTINQLISPSTSLCLKGRVGVIGGYVQIWADCFPCILKMSLGIARVAIKDEDGVKRFMKEILRSKYFNNEGWEVTSPEVIKEIWLKVIEFTGIADPMREIKDEQNNKALAIYSRAKELVFKSKDPLLGAIKLAIAGNSIDAMTNVQGEAPEEVLERWHRSEIDNKNLEFLKERLEKTNRLSYLGDNCGEIVFDRLLMEVLLKRYHLEITFITRTRPVMNDATLQDARSIGIGKVAEIAENGIQEPIPGTYLKKISPETKTLIERSDLVISKGGGNYDSLTEEEGFKGKISFLFVAKCHPYCSIHQVSLNAPVIYNS